MQLARTTSPLTLLLGSFAILCKLLKACNQRKTEKALSDLKENVWYKRKMKTKKKKKIERRTRRGRGR